MVTSVWNGRSITTRVQGSNISRSTFLIAPDGAGHMLAFDQDPLYAGPHNFSWSIRNLAVGWSDMESDRSFD